MPRYYSRSLFGFLVRVFAGLTLLVLFFVGVEWLLTDFLPTVAPWAAATGGAALLWVVSRLHG